MNSSQDPTALVLSVHPTYRGFGWTLFEAPESIVEWGMASAVGKRRARLIDRFEQLLDRYRPAVVVLEEYDGKGQRAERIQALCRDMSHMVLLQGADVIVYPRARVQSVFARLGATERHEIAEAIAANLPVLSHRLPTKRKRWEPESHRQSLFNAAALALTYYALKGEK